MEFTCEQIGMDQEELQERVVAGLVEKILLENDDQFVQGQVMTEVGKRVLAAIDEKVVVVCDEFVLPRIEALVDDLCLQKTNRWGEKVGEKMTFTEYLIQRAEQYLTIDVNTDGESKGESRSSYWSKSQTRISHMIDKHLHYEISRAMKAAVDEANKSITEGLEEACKIKLAEIGESLKVEVKTK
jgi:hypothetical protein